MWRASSTLRAGGAWTRPLRPHTAEASLTGKLRAILPGAAVALFAGIAIWTLDDANLEMVTGRYALVLYGVGSVVAALFHRSRVVVGLLGLAFVYLATARAPAGQDPFLAFGTFLLALLGLLAVVRDRGIRSRGGLIQLCVGASMAYGSFLAFGDPATLDAFAALRPLPLGPLSDLGVPQATFLVGSMSLFAAGYGIYRWRGPVERALLWSQLLLLWSMHSSTGSAEASLLLMAGGLVLALSVLEQSYSMAYRDELTGLPARRALMHDLAEVGGTFTIAMVDVDHFKNFNDKHGHDVGDQVLQLVASRLAVAPGGGKAYRYGGEEFTLLYPGRVRDDAIPHADAVRSSVEEASFALRSWNRPKKKPEKNKAKDEKPKPKRKKRGPRRLSVTVSIGLADSTGKDPTPEAVLKKADKALYRAKTDGRNRVSK